MAAKDNRGYDIAVIYENDRERFKCMLCMDIIRTATYACENHVFCRLCLEDYIDNNKNVDMIKCPAGCGKVFDKNELQSNHPTDKFVNKILCKCTDCCWQGELKNYVEHHKDYCEEKKIPCNLCKSSVKRRYLIFHVENECSRRLIKCQYCSTPVAFDDYVVHEKRCASEMSDCFYHCVGCEFKDTSKKVVAHEKDAQVHLKLISKFITDNLENEKKLQESVSLLNRKFNLILIENQTIKSEYLVGKERFDEVYNLCNENRSLLNESSCACIWEHFNEFNRKINDISNKNEELKIEINKEFRQNKSLIEENQRIFHLLHQFESKFDCLNEKLNDFQKENENLKTLNINTDKKIDEVIKENELMKNILRKICYSNKINVIKESHDKEDIYVKNVSMEVKDSPSRKISADKCIHSLRINKQASFNLASFINYFIHYLSQGPCVNLIWFHDNSTIIINCNKYLNQNNHTENGFYKGNFSSIINFLINTCDKLIQFKEELKLLICAQKAILLINERKRNLFFKKDLFSGFEDDFFALQKYVTSFNYKNKKAAPSNCYLHTSNANVNIYEDSKGDSRKPSSNFYVYRKPSDYIYDQFIYEIVPQNRLNKHSRNRKVLSSIF